MVSISTCAECKGKGKYKVYNAYDLTFEEEVICEYCDGEGTFIEPLFSSPRKNKTLDDEWVN